MDKIFVDILEQIHDLICVGEKALSGDLSESGKKKYLENPDSIVKRQNSWARYVKEIKQKYELLSGAINQATSYEKNTQINQRLAYFRELPRRLSDGSDPVWSAYYPEIKKLLGDIYSTRVEIEKKYKLGQHKNDL